MEKIYTAKVTATGGRNGTVKSVDGSLDIETRRPKEMGGTGGVYANPEILFAGGYAACFDSALNLVIRSEHVITGTTSVTAEVSIGKLDDREGFGLAVVLTIMVPGIENHWPKPLSIRPIRSVPIPTPHGAI
jgi:Ohr subfamily peroxiredoxin